MISKNWTPEERLEIISKIVERLMKHPAIKRNQDLFDIVERLFFLTNYSAFFLENNREKIIDGNTKNS